MRTVTAVAHRGDPYRFRENTLPSLRSALERGADAVEIDVRLSSDGVPVLLHDPTLKRLWGYDRPLGVLSSAELDGLTEGGVPTLEAAIAATEGHRLMLDLPDASYEAVRTVVGVIAAGGAAERTYYCAGPRTMLAVREADPAAEIALTWTTLAPPRRVLLDAVKPRWLNYRFPLLDRDLVSQVHRQGFLVSAWTPDTRRSMRRLIDAGVDAITTNRIDVLTALRDS
ncbi:MULTISPECIES: glycerophosphodiester phosphodiesterase [Streptomyces]|uniref:glycerophosphodiester phosphodiesterase n=1 Tax=Streptomyces TaxID=1883 RepID=UPI001E488C44|nr:MULTISPECIES: glycerophosphodiester phosphodiesterase [Streptomyces]UFQ18362.1 glycerophosphodiester phosphodiesterase [Streptomyces huasconensis]WCL87975.1 glycerophosphodiester phosphodiesterase [Streptomyces sp. JCM 35825]